MLNVMIVQRDPIAGKLIELLIDGSEGFQVSACFSAAACVLQELADERMDLALIDACEIEAAVQLKAQQTWLKVIAVAREPECGYIERAKESGADSFFYLQPDAKLLFDVINRTMAGESVYPQQMIVHLGDALSTDLTDREIQVLREVVAGNTDAEIADRLSVSLRTVKGHIQNLREKTGYRNRTELAVNARAIGLIV